MAKFITLTWIDPETVVGGGLNTVTVSAPTLNQSDRDEIERIAIKWGFITGDKEWTVPESSEAAQGFNNEARRDDFVVVWSGP